MVLNVAYTDVTNKIRASLLLWRYMNHNLNIFLFLEKICVAVETYFPYFPNLSNALNPETNEAMNCEDCANN